MSRSLALASIVGGIVLALGMLLIPFTADAATWAVTVGNDEADRVEVGGECGTLFAHYISGPVNPACESPAKDRSWMAGKVLPPVTVGPRIAPPSKRTPLAAETPTASSA